MKLDKLENKLRELEFDKHIAKQIEDTSKLEEIQDEIDKLVKRIEKELKRGK